MNRCTGPEGAPEGQYVEGLVAPLLCAKQAWPRMIDGGQGSVVFTGPEASSTIVPAEGPPAAVRGGLGLAAEHAAKRVRVNDVCIGPAAMYRSRGGVEGKGRRVVPTRGSGTLAEIAAVVAFSLPTRRIW